MVKTLELIFKNSQDRNVRISIVNAREDLTGAEVKAVMDKIVEESLFMPGNLQLVEVDSAVIVTVTRDQIELA